MSTAPVDVARAAYDAFASGDMEAFAALLAPDTRWQIGDVPPLNGEYAGPERDGRTLDVHHVHVMQVEDGRIARFWGATSDPAADEEFWR